MSKSRPTVFERRRADGIKLELGPVSIQWCEADPGPCVVCARHLGAGPVGFTLGDPPGPTCDGCLLQLHEGLGMLLMMVNINRELAAADDRDPADQKLVALMTVSKIYDRGARWPTRPVAVLEYLRELESLAARLPLQALLKLVDGPSH